MIAGIDFVSLPVTDMARAKAFYVDQLGLKPGDGVGTQWVEFDLGPGPALALIDAASYGMPTDPVVTGSVALAVQDFEGCAASLKERQTKEPFESPVCHGAFVKDTEGNTVLLHRRKSEPTRNHEIDFVCLPIQDMARARAFYEGVLGLTPDNVQGDGWCEYVLPDGSALALGDVRALGMEFTPVKGGSVGLRTPDLEAMYEKVKALGQAHMPAPYESPVCFMGFIQDSEGNALVLHRHK
jgi:predicted enzyme related to lactoylglutathione lyase